MHRIMGLETEYGILAPQNPQASPMTMSGLVVTSYGPRASDQGVRTSWDYEDEAPLRDARGYTMERAKAHPTQLTDRPREMADGEDLATANLVLTNGARLYVDHAHPEYSSPEVTNPYDAVRFDRAGEEIMRQAGAAASHFPDTGEIRLYKNNTDNKGASYGTHENYLMPRATPFGRIVRGLLPFFASRLLYTGNGRIGIGDRGQQPGYQISQRADFMEVEVGLETTLKRPIVNTRDEPHASADQYRRLHVIVGDANLCDVATYLKMGTTALVLSLIDNDCAPKIKLADPVKALQTWSRDLSLTATAKCDDGSQVTALDVQWMYLEAASKFVADRSDEDPGGRTADVLQRWESVLTKLGKDIMSCAAELDWVAKLRVLNGYRERDNLDWNHSRLELIDVQYSDMRERGGIFSKLAQSGKIERLVSDDEVMFSIRNAPEDTRAYFRGRCIERFSNQVTAASWDSVILDIPGASQLHRIPMMDPHRGTASHVRELLDTSETAEDLVVKLTGGS